jgi:hypothetical protein
MSCILTCCHLYSHGVFHIFEIFNGRIPLMFFLPVWNFTRFYYFSMKCHVFVAHCQVYSTLLLCSGMISWWVVVKVTRSSTWPRAHHVVSMSCGVDARHDRVMLLLGHYSHWTRRHGQVVGLSGLRWSVSLPHGAMGWTRSWGSMVGITLQMWWPHGRCRAAPLSSPSLVDAAVTQIQVGNWGIAKLFDYI